MSVRRSLNTFSMLVMEDDLCPYRLPFKDFSEISYVFPINNVGWDRGAIDDL